jgi:sulfur relay (sulfurtransferase) complex TusBCD TusD component (DsrE family)
MAKTLFILNDPPYGTERSYNGHGGEIGVCATCMDARALVTPS